MKEIACPRCGIARSSAATFCMNCGQDLRPGAPVKPLQPPEPPAPAASEAKPGRGPAERAARAFKVIRPPSRPGSPPASAAKKVPGGPPTTRARPQPETAAPTPDPNLSFSERYRGTAYLSPEVEALLPSGPEAVVGARRRLAIVGIVVVALVLASAAGAYAFLFAPSARDDPGAFGFPPTPTPTPTPPVRATPTPLATIHGLVPDEVEIAGCIVGADMIAERAELGALEADIAADRTAGASQRARSLAAEVAATQGSVAEMAGFAPAKALVAAYGQVFSLEADALAEMADADDDPKRLAAATDRLAGLEPALSAVAAAGADLLARFPEMACGAAP